jgi:hypothetical protein
MPSIEERLASIEANIRSTVDIWRLHTEQDMQQFTALREDIHAVGEKVDALRLAEAKRQGEATAVKRVSGLLGGIVAACVLAVSEAVRYLLGV